MDWFLSVLYPTNPLVYHITPVDKLDSIIKRGGLYSDRGVREAGIGGSVIGYGHIKERRLRTSLRSHPTLTVGDCVPFYFCYRSPMLYAIARKNQDLEYRDGEHQIVYLVSKIHDVVGWADEHGRRWLFTGSNASASDFEEYTSLNCLNKLDWEAIKARHWPDVVGPKQAEFLVESFVSWELVGQIGVKSDAIRYRVLDELGRAEHQPRVMVRPNWYYG